MVYSNVGKINCNISDNEKTLVFFCSVLVFFEMKKTRFFFTQVHCMLNSLTNCMGGV